MPRQKNLKAVDLELAKARRELAEAVKLNRELVADLHLNEALARAYAFRVRRMKEPVSNQELEQIMLRGYPHHLR